MSNSSSFTSLPSSHRHLDDGGKSTGSGMPKFKSLPPPSLPISPPTAIGISPFSYFGLNPSDFLDSPVLLSSSNILPSPTTGTFPSLAFGWKGELDRTQLPDMMMPEQNDFSGFPFRSNAGFSYGRQQKWDDQEANYNQGVLLPSDDLSSTHQFESGQAPFQSENDPSGQPSQGVGEMKSLEDGYNWRKYGQKQVKGSENPRSYYKCTHPNCPTRKHVETSWDGRITEIVYRGGHTHPKPQSTRRASAGSTSSTASACSVVIQSNNNELSEQQSAYGSSSAAGGVSCAVSTPPENSTISYGDDDGEQKGKSRGGDEFDEDQPPHKKRWKGESSNDGSHASEMGSRTVKEPRVVVQTTSDIDILIDGYRWRKYGQKVVKGNPFPRSYYKCTSPECRVRKHVERASHDPRAVITTYEGKHNHDVPVSRGSGTNGITRPMPKNPRNHPAMATAAVVNYAMPICGGGRPLSMEAETAAPHTLDMVFRTGEFDGFEY